MTPEIEHFVREARAYSQFVETAATLSPRERLETARARLAAVYVAGLALPLVTLDDPEAPDPDMAAPSWPGFAEHDLYWDTLEPFDLSSDAPSNGVGSLDDDVCDTYRDLKHGLLSWDAGRRSSAVLHWRVLFMAHWGDHAVRALRVLHEACS